ncbi:YggS family pyridoxal phosphate-dependent enzyme [Dongia rigui]|uniref:Pyridoxal phosphate homeostasis protein n=1 Tax=Dongia rigui TaxID=940149 RepID=A0ABU5DY01_9PROT|nr:YggS family pyridoxal phosphate-dependent enzyme [Dongia rigui]MDY0872139.1 YggS family pyridoxal phosphate-dependent enzyme [Dongia rigui]
MTDFPHIASNLAEIRDSIAAAAKAADRPADTIHLIAVSKTHPAEAVLAAITSGQTVFGENRVQEAQAKFPALKAMHPALELHLIGPLQSNKVREAVALFDVIQSVDREKLAQALADEMQKQKRVLRLFIQVNIGEEPQKAGVNPAEIDAFVKLCRDELKLGIDGLMCIPPADKHPAPYFALLREMARRNNLTELSMGMSGDFETAIQFGATHVRVGTAIFGQR